MDDLIEQITNLENLYWAWEKAQYFYKLGDIWFDALEVSNFEANLAEEFKIIKNQILDNEYKIAPIKPLPFPRTPDENGPRIRQSFHISVRDQVAWLAIVNIIGPHLDYRMPFWSYGNRLYVSVFYEQKNFGEKKELKFGWYRHTSKYTYRKWTQSWPLYRKHIAITAKIMAYRKKFRDSPKKFRDQILDEEQREILEQNELLPSHLKVKYLERSNWEKQLSGKVFWAGIDLKDFYPKINLKVIIDNYNKYFPLKNKSRKLEDLLKNMLQLPIDYSGWNKKELSKIGLENKPCHLEGIPTGLFTAGFLANVSLLRVDKLVDNELKRHKNFAHFRFVDDHVFLFDSFDELDEWIRSYQGILMKCKTSAEINENKTEPDNFKKYVIECNKEDAKKSEIEEKKNQAEKETKLDPKFLSPLMTQTLAKVSKIAGTDFEILDENEQDQLISDIEHLLITDFPDQELRKDTRISFAATRLSRLVPKRWFDTSELYEIEKQIIQLKKEKKEKNKQLKIIKDESKNYIKLNEEIKDLEVDIRKKIEKKGEIIKKQERKELNLRQNTFNLLWKAIKENHEKVRLWTRLLEYCLRMGEEKIERIFSLLEDLKKDKDANYLSAGFIHAMILQVLVELIIRSYFIIRESKYSISDKIRAKRFLSNILKINFLKEAIHCRNNESKFYFRESIDLFKFALGSILYLFISESEIKSENEKFIYRLLIDYEKLIEKINIIDWRNEPEFFTARTKYSLGSWSWWIIQKTSDKLSGSANLIWKNVLKKLDYYKPADLAVSVLYPREIPLEIFKNIIESKKATTYLNEEGWIYDVLRNFKSESRASLNIVKRKIQKIIRILDSKLNDYLNLIEWAEWTKEQYYRISFDKIGSFDPRVSEWTALEIIRQIAELINAKARFIYLNKPQDLKKLFSERDSHFYKIHPSNYLVSKKWIELEKIPTWEKWNEIIKSLKSKIKTKTKKENFIFDSRYTPTIKTPYNQNNKELSVINGFGVLLLGLLIKNYNFPPFWNPLGLQRAWISLARKSLSYYAVSSRTAGIIDACFSKRNRETKLIKIFQKDVFRQPSMPDDDTIYDPPEIFTIKDFLNQVKRAQKVLEKYQLTVQDHKPRQLIPVSLIQLTREYNPYEDLEDE